MSLTLTNAPMQETPPFLLTPVYTPTNFHFRLMSDLSARTDFEYIYDVYTINQVTGTESERIIRERLFARPDGSGIYSPYRVLENYVSYDFSPYGTGFTSSPNSLLHYRMKFGESYSISGLTFSAITDNGGFTQYNFNTTPNPQFIVGDTIKISKQYKNYNLDYDGLQIVSQVSGADITTDKVYGVAQIESGECVSRLTIQTAITVSGICFNAAAQYLDADTNFGDIYFLKDNTRRFLSEYTGTIRVQPGDVYTLGGIEYYSAVTHCLIVTYDISDTSIGVFTFAKSASSYKSFDMRCGPGNLTGLVETNLLTLSAEPIFNSAVTKYTLLLVNGVNDISDTLTFIVDEQCGYNKIRLAWLNTLGKWNYMNFNMKRKRKVETERTFAGQILPWNYDIGDESEIISSIKTTEILELNSYDFLTEEECALLEYLYTSPRVFYLDNQTSTWRPFIVTSKEYIEKTIDNDKSRQFKIEGRMGYGANLQRN